MSVSYMNYFLLLGDGKTETVEGEEPPRIQFFLYGTKLYDKSKDTLKK